VYKLSYYLLRVGISPKSTFHTTVDNKHAHYKNYIIQSAIDYLTIRISSVGQITELTLVTWHKKIQKMAIV